MTPSDIPSSSSLNAPDVGSRTTSDIEAEVTPGPSQRAIEVSGSNGSTQTQSVEATEDDEEDGDSDPTSPGDSSDTTTSNGIEPAYSVRKEESQIGNHAK